jgi:Tfp pilus assembly protein PilX
MMPQQTRWSAARPSAARSSEGGFALLAILLVIVVLTGLAAVTQLTSRTELRIGANTYASSQAYYAAEAGVEKLLAEMRSQMAAGFLTAAKVETVTLDPPTIPGFTFKTYTAKLDTTVTVRSITQGPFAGLTSMDQPLVVNASVESAAGARSTVEVSARTQAIPIFQFAVFYDEDLEILPGPLMNLRGRVHTNGDLYVDGDDGLYLWNMVTSAGDLHLHRKASSGGGSDGKQNYIEASDGSWIELQKDTHAFGGDDNPTTFPSKDDDKAFDDYSKSNWEHRVQTRASGIVSMRLPIPDGTDPYSIIQPCTGAEPEALEKVRYACQADMVIRLDGTVLKIQNGSGTAKVLMDANAVKFAPNKFYDDREQSSSSGTSLTGNNSNSNRDVIEIDVSKLTQAEYGNGIVYVTADSTTLLGVLTAPKDQRQFVVRVRGGKELKDPLTIATNLPLYVMGDYNDDDAKWQPASLVSDAVTILSNQWDDSKSGEGATEQKPDDVKIQAAIMSGHTPTPFYGSPDAGGQFENFPRFLEDWTDVTVTLNGSMISMWNPRDTASKWECCNYYVPPKRDWNFDERYLDPAQLPPATPVVGQLLRVGFVRRY